MYAGDCIHMVPIYKRSPAQLEERMSRAARLHHVAALAPQTTGQQNPSFMLLATPNCALGGLPTAALQFFVQSFGGDAGSNETWRVFSEG